MSQEKRGCLLLMLRRSGCADGTHFTGLDLVGTLIWGICFGWTAPVLPSLMA